MGLLNKDKYYLILDLETSGVDCTVHEILETGLILTDHNFNVLRSTSIKTIPKSKNLTVNIQALKVNKINLINHSWDSIDTSLLLDSINQIIFNTVSDPRKIILVGHRVSFDIGFLRELQKKLNYELPYLRGKDVIDTAVVANFLGINFKNLKNLGEILGVPSNGVSFHTALSDCQYTLEVLKKLTELVQKGV